MRLDKNTLTIFTFLLLIGGSALVLPPLRGSATPPSTSQVGVLPNELQVNDTAVEFTLPSLIGEGNYTLSQFDGKMLMLDLMATWCSPCQRAMPEIRQLYYRFYATGKFDIISVGIDQSETDDELLDFYNRFNVDWHFARDVNWAINGNQSLWDIYGTGYIPTLYLIWNRTVIYMEIGWAGVDALTSIIENYLPADTVNPEINAVNFHPKTGNSVSIDNPDYVFEVDATDDRGVMAVDVTVNFGNTTQTYNLIEPEEGTLWTLTTSFPLLALYNATELNFTITVIDFYRNNISLVPSTGANISVNNAVTHIEDSEPPSVTELKVTSSIVGSMYTIRVEFQATDNYLLTQVSVLVDYGNGTTDLFDVGSADGITYVRQFMYDHDVLADGYTFKLVVNDLGNNKQIIDLEVPPFAGTQSISTESAPETSEATGTSGTPASFAFMLLGLTIATAVLSRKRQ